MFSKHKQKKFKPQSFNSKQDFNFQLLDENRVLMTGAFSAFTEDVKQLIKQHQGQYSNYDGDKGWAVPIGLYQNLIEKLKQLQSNVAIKQLPLLLQKLQDHRTDQIKWLENGQFITISYENMTDIRSLDEKLNEKLYPYQRECIDQGIKFKGRILIADEMGVGKTVQSLALASIYQYAWPLLIISPSALRLNWQDEIIHWLKIAKTDIQIITSGKEAIRLNARIVIISYDLCSKLQESLQHRQFKICIADECHYIKSSLAQRSQVCLPILRQCRHVILLTGTPALAKPKDLFNSLNIIRPDIFSSFKEFGYRYCDPKLSKFINGIDFDGASNLKELHYLLKNYIMIRRLKKDVLSQLPEKRRIRVRIPGDPSHLRQINALMSKLENCDIQQLVNREMNFTEPRWQNDSQEQLGVNAILAKCYLFTGQAKIKAIKDYISDLFENEIKFLFFAHHHDVLDAVQDYCLQNKIQFIRIDGNVNAEQKHINVRMFQQCEEIRIAILSLTAANTGITLTAASTIVFGEMHWTPAVMIQAEDRAHRIGQEQCVDCHYLIGDGTIDEQIYQKIESKFNTVSNFIDGKNVNLGAFEGTIQEIIVKPTQKSELQQQDELQPSPKSINDEDLEAIFQLLEQSKQKEKAKSQIQPGEQLIISNDVQKCCSQLKQTFLDKFMTSNKAKKEVIENQKEMSNIKQTLDTRLSFGNEPKKLGFDYLQNRLKSDTKSTEQEIAPSKRRKPYINNEAQKEEKSNLQRLSQDQ